MKFSLVQVEPRPKRMPGDLRGVMEIRQYILEMDEAIVAVNKPAGMLTIADGYDSSLPHLAGLLQQELGRIWTVHRLDKDTSGVILFARSAEAHRNLNKQFQKHEIEKRYRVLVVGLPGWESKKISLPLKVNGDRSHRTIIDPARGKPAETEIRVLESIIGISHLEASPNTGYTHQIRAHLAASGLPIINDPLYKSRLPLTAQQTETFQRIFSLPIKRTALHAQMITFCHPISSQRKTIEVVEPEDFQETLKALKSLAIA